ncbi:hypothetical protein SynBIOSE41_01941 [Synechococcus sp. BIOS-E4-1]|nr:hypothetical protein SynBIOSE41_01941 [Synechococcus sp. BIOS-E4-1]
MLQSPEMPIHHDMDGSKIKQCMPLKRHAIAIRFIGADRA